MGGIGILSDCLMAGGDLQIQALRVIHTASANNVKFQMKLLETEAGIVPWLLQVCTQLLRSSFLFIMLAAVHGPPIACNLQAMRG
jgi:hypothetical protein